MNRDSLNRESLNRESSERSSEGTVQQMNKPAASSKAWQPFTPHGLIAFSKTTFGRVFLLLCLTALIAAGTVVWFLKVAWFPAIRAAIHELPPQGQIIRQELNTPRVSAEPLAEHRYLGFVVLMSDTPGPDLNSHVAVKFRKKGFEICSIFGCWPLAYPRGWTIAFNRTDLEPGWGAWEPVVTVLAAVGTFMGLLILWLGLGFLYSIAAWIVARVKTRDLTWLGSWKMCSAGLIPGALLFVAAIWLYGFGVLDVLQFFVLAVLQFVLGWLCIVFAWRALSSAAPLGSSLNNPFAGPVTAEQSTARNERTEG